MIGSVQKKFDGNQSLFNKSFESIIHRGPDDSGMWSSSDQLVRLAHRRLAIIDLTETGHQPMLDSNREFVIVFNGEIYNFLKLRDSLSELGVQFRSHSDTEVLIEGYKIWGEALLTKLEGMFAFAIFDLKKKELFLARDIAGEKPLYFFNNGDKFYFGSEHKALRILSSSYSINDKNLSEYLMRGYVSSSNTLVNKIFQLTPGSCLTLDCGSLAFNIKQYWKPPARSEKKKSITNLAPKLTDLLFSSVEKTLISDVPVGILLSGGLDSSLITAIASRITPNLKTFSVSFSDHLGFDESEHSRNISKHFKTEHLELNASNITAKKFEYLASNFDLPIGDTSVIPTYVLSEEVAKYCKVVLGGDGADELFGGYHRYAQIEKFHAYSMHLPRAIQNILAYLANQFPVGVKGRQWIKLLDNIAHNQIRNPSIFFDLADQSNLLKNFNGEINHLFQDDCFTFESGEILNSLAEIDFHNYLPNDILLKVDRSSMLHSLEVRAPFLCKDIVEFSFEHLSSDKKIRNGQKKYLLKEVAKKILPSDFEFHRKQGFSFPFNSMLIEKEWNELFKKYMYSDASSFQVEYIEELRSNHLKIKNNSERLFSLLFFEIWKQNNLNINQ